MSKVRELREAQKSLASKISFLKNEYNDKQRKRVVGSSDYLKTLWELLSDKKEFRNKHIGYSLARGKTREQIERPSKHNKPIEDLILAAFEAYREAQDADQLAYEGIKTDWSSVARNAVS